MNVNDPEASMESPKTDKQPKKNIATSIVESKQSNYNTNTVLETRIDPRIETGYEE